MTIDEIERKIAARRGQAGYARNVEELEAELKRLKESQDNA